MIEKLNIRNRKIIKQISLGIIGAYILSSLFIYKFIYIDLFNNINPSEINLNIEELERKSSGIKSAGEKMYTTTNNDPWFLISEINEDKKYIYIDMSNMSNNIDISIYYAMDSKFSEANKIDYSLSSGVNIIKIPSFKKYNTLRLDFGDKEKVSFSIDELKICNYISMSEDIYMCMGFILVILATLVLYKHRIINLVKKTKLDKEEFIFVLFCMFIYYLWSTLIPFGEGPDESMRYDIAKFIFENRQLPHGGDPSIRNEVWGISYGFTPILSYIFSSILMIFASELGVQSERLFLAARLVSVLSSTITVIFTIKISKEVFKSNCKWIFIAFVSLLPQFIFISSYVNNDAFAIMCTSIIIFYWIRGIKNRWETRDCIGLGIGISLCSLSYYNTYGFILVSILLFFISNVYDINNRKFLDIDRNKFNKMAIKVSVIIGIFIAMSSWWFIRNYIIYDGDILGMKTANIYSDMYAIDSLKASSRKTIANQGYSLKYMLFDMGWIKSTIRSFIGTFGAMQIYLKPFMYKIYYILFAVGALGILIKNRSTEKEHDNISGNLIFNTSICLVSFITIILSIYYSYNSDFQPQGRYIMPVLIPLMYGVTVGFKNIISYIYTKYNLEINIIILIMLYFIMSIYSLTNIIIPYYFH